MTKQQWIGIAAAIVWAWIPLAADALQALETDNDSSFEQAGRSAGTVPREVVYFVSPDGSDANSRSAERPFQTLAGAQAMIRQNVELGAKPLTVFLRQATYFLDQPLVFRARDSGTARAPVTWAVYPSEQVIISGGARLTLSWQSFRGGILQAQMPEGLAIDQLFINGKRQHMARYANYDSDVEVYNGHAADAFAPQRANRWGDPAGGFIACNA